MYMVHNSLANHAWQSPDLLGTSPDHGRVKNPLTDRLIHGRVQDSLANHLIHDRVQTELLGKPPDFHGKVQNSLENYLIHGISESRPPWHTI
jgi:hypothetical protein